MAENESERTTEASKDGDERFPIAGDMNKQGKPPSWNDIPRFGLGKFIIYANLIFTFLAVITGGRSIRPPGMPAETVPRSASLFSAIFFFVILVLFLGLRKRKKYGLLLFYVLEGLQILFGFTLMLAGPVSSTGALRPWGNEPLLRVMQGGAAVGIACALLVYFYKRRQYFNR